MVSWMLDSSRNYRATAGLLISLLELAAKRGLWNHNEHTVSQSLSAPKRIAEELIDEFMP